MAPIAVQGVLIRYWLAHAGPRHHRSALGRRGHRSGDAARRNTLVAGMRGQLRQFTIDGATWGRQRILAGCGRPARGGRRDERQGCWLRGGGTGARARQGSLRARGHSHASGRGAIESRAIPPLRRDTFALTNGRLVDATGAPPIERAVVVIRNGRIEAAGLESTTPVPRGVPIVDVSGKTSFRASGTCTRT